MAQQAIKSIQLIKNFQFGTKLTDKLITSNDCQMSKEKNSILILINNQMYEVPVSFCVIEYA